MMLNFCSVLPDFEKGIGNNFLGNVFAPHVPPRISTKANIIFPKKEYIGFLIAND